MKVCKIRPCEIWPSICVRSCGYVCMRAHSRRCLSIIDTCKKWENVEIKKAFRTFQVCSNEMNPWGLYQLEGWVEPGGGGWRKAFLRFLTTVGLGARGAVKAASCTQLALQLGGQLPIWACLVLGLRRGYIFWGPPFNPQYFIFLSSNSGSRGLLLVSVSAWPCRTACRILVPQRGIELPYPHCCLVDNLFIQSTDICLFVCLFTYWLHRVLVATCRIFQL